MKTLDRDPNWPLKSFDAVDWAKAFMDTFEDDLHSISEDLMRAWFANALMRGFDEHAWRYPAHNALLSALEEVNSMACYASEEDTSARAECLLKIGQIARAALAQAAPTPAADRGEG